MPNPLYLRYYPPGVTSGCCPGEYYAVVFNNNEKALLLSGGTYTFQDYTAATHDNFEILLTEFSERDLCYHVDLANVDAAATPTGEQYTIEFWRNDTPANPNSRADDELLSTVNFIWDGEAVANNHPSAKDQLANTPYEVSFNISYNPAGKTLSWQAFLHKAGRLHSAVDTCLVTVYNGSSTFASQNSGSALIPAHGVFAGQITNLTLSADTIYFCSVRITDTNGVTYTSGASLITWQ